MHSRANSTCLRYGFALRSADRTALLKFSGGSSRYAETYKRSVFGTHIRTTQRTRLTFDIYLRKPVTLSHPSNIVRTAKAVVSTSASAEIVSTAWQCCDAPHSEKFRWQWLAQNQGVFQDVDKLDLILIRVVASSVALNTTMIGVFAGRSRHHPDATLLPPP
ncbi:hypothetical protein HYPSUDRAFT_605060 [Hypholoma sublateritium FD-334 SS-4]|uniref:Uncharacterized protein n=1 Tax=Hypholoma sublateritium (strain FD-334 SS-4) TaxID=945553 RepID=A0A0D2KEZ3_HYPSF|nr:hypothetical protein HYPSUDRAFT_605060 [Hypholoma sublateritium FD-334 SS-4]